MRYEGKKYPKVTKTQKKHVSNVVRDTLQFTDSDADMFLLFMSLSDT